MVIGTVFELSKIGHLVQAFFALRPTVELTIFGRRQPAVHTRYSTPSRGQHTALWLKSLNRIISPYYSPRYGMANISLDLDAEGYLPFLPAYHPSRR